MQKIKVDNEFKAIIPPLTPDEYKQLEVNLVADGCRDPLVTWQGILLDGHNRLEICKAHDLKYQTMKLLSIKDRTEAKAWIINNQCGRRNLNTYQRSMLALQLEEILVPDATLRMQSGKKLDPMQKLAQGTTIDKIAAVAGVSRETLRKVKYVETRISESAKDELRQGKRSVSDVYQGVKDREPMTDNARRFSDQCDKLTQALTDGFNEATRPMLDDYLKDVTKKLYQVRQVVLRIKGNLGNVQYPHTKRKFIREVEDLSKLLSEITEESKQKKRKVQDETLQKQLSGSARGN